MGEPRRFRVWARCAHRDGEECEVEMPADATDKACDAACIEALDTIIGNLFDTGWDEIAAPESPDKECGR